jgi:ABC-type multidrug transport system ATPase subunit
MARVDMAIFGLSRTYNTKVGNDYIRGVSGGEGKRVSIAEMMIAGSPISAWDSSTRGLNSASSLKFVQALRPSSDIGNHAHAVAIYQASQSIYDAFDKATVLYAGRQIYFRPASSAKTFFERQGWYYAPRQTTGDFLTAVTNPDERTPRKGMEGQVPQTPEDFERYWHESPEFKTLLQDMDRYEQDFQGGETKKNIAALREQKNHMQAKHVRPKSPYIISMFMQVRLNTVRAYRRLWNDFSATLSYLIAQLITAFIWFHLLWQPRRNHRLLGQGLFAVHGHPAQRPNGHLRDRRAVRPAAHRREAQLVRLPSPGHRGRRYRHRYDHQVSHGHRLQPGLYFLAGLRRTPDQFFLYFLVSYVSTFVMSAVFRTLAAITKTASQAMALSDVLVLALVNFTGFTQPPPPMHPWFGCIRWINPIFYAFEILVANEFHDREFICSAIMPPYTHVSELPGSAPASGLSRDGTQSVAMRTSRPTSTTATRTCGATLHPDRFPRFLHGCLPRCRGTKLVSIQHR